MRLQVASEGVSPKGSRARALLLGAAAGLLVAGFASGTASAAEPQAKASAKIRSICPATFSVLHNDRIGAIKLPKGAYRVTLLSSTMTCAQASKYFARFLQDYDGKLGGGWTGRSRGLGKGTFSRNSVPMFAVDSCSSVGGCSGPTPPSPVGKACPGYFHVLHDDKIGSLSFPAGYYKLVIPKGSTITCPNAAKLFAEFLDYPSGNLPSGWAVKTDYALFFKKANPAQYKFRVDPGY